MRKHPPYVYGTDKPQGGVSIFLSGIKMLVSGHLDDISILDQAISATQLYVQAHDLKPTPAEGRELADFLNQLYEQRRVLSRNLSASFALLDVRDAILRKVGKYWGSHVEQ